jgi:hypothetical protein
VRRAAVAVAAFAAAIAVLAMAGPAPAGPASAGEPLVRTLVLRLHDVSLPELLALPAVRSLATRGGAALLSRPGELDAELSAAREQGPALGVGVEDLGSGADALEALAARLQAVDRTQPAPHDQIWVLSDGSGSPGDELGSVVLYPAAVAPGPGPRALTSDSTRRDGVVATPDVLPTMCELARTDCVTGGPGSVMRAVDAPPPVELYDRYLASRRMSVPIQTAAGLFVTFAGVLGVALLALRRRVPAWLSSIGAWTAISVVPLATSLLLAGHLSTLSYATVLPAVVGGTLGGTLAFVPVARARGTVDALAWMGAATFALFLLEAALGWTGALHTFLGGTELDGGRFYGLPNVDIGLLLGASVYVAYRIPDIGTGVALIASVALFAGLPFAGANLGAAVTIAATAGLWGGLRGERGVLRTAAAMLVGAAAGLVVTLVLNRYLPGPATHITEFVEGRGGGLLSTVAHRFGTGLHLIAQNPFAIVPVLGVPATLFAVLRPPSPVAASFARHRGWREALLTILLGSVVAYVANDTGAAALGLGFGTALGGLLFVSLRDRPWMMEGT